MNRLIDASLSENTRAAYDRGIKFFDEFRSKYSLVQKWPPHLNDLVSYVADLSLRGISAATVRMYLSGIGYKCKIMNTADVTQNFIVNKMVEGIKRLHSRSDARAPITLDILQRIIKILPVICKSSYETELFTAAYITAYFGFLRVGEIVVSSNASVGSGHYLRMKDVTLNHNEEKVMLKLSHSKTDQYANGVVIVLSKGSSKLCPYTSLHNYMKIRPHVNGPFFCHFGGNPLTRYQFSAVLSKAIAAISENTKLFKSHSFRIGASTSASMLGLTEDEIKILGRWKSQVVRDYIRVPCKKLSGQ